MKLSLFIPGVPKTAGSKRAFPIWKGRKGETRTFTGRTVLVDTTGDAGKRWRADVRSAVMAERKVLPIETGSLTVHMTFLMPRPKSHYGTGKNANVLKDTAPKAYEHLQDPDALKLARAVEDALTGVLWKDDNQLRGFQEKAWRPPDVCGMLLDVQDTESYLKEHSAAEGAA